MSINITIIRHAPTEYNKNNIFMGTKDILVDEMELVGDRIEKIRNNKYLQGVYDWYSSPLSRAVETAKAITINKNIVLDDRLIERCLGDWQGLNKDIVKLNYPEAFIGGKIDFYHTPINGESYEKLVLRISEFVVEKSKDSKDLVVVTHNGVFRVMKSLFTGERFSEVFSEFEPYLEPQTFTVTDEILERISENPFYTKD